MIILVKDKTFEPVKATAGAACFDIKSTIATTIYPREWKLIPAGFWIIAGESERIDIRPRSGLAMKHGITVLNAPGTIDSDYTGEIGVLLINHGYAPFLIEIGDRIAQAMVVNEMSRNHIECMTVDNPVDFIAQHREIRDGFGSTGVK